MRINRNNLAIFGFTFVSSVTEFSILNFIDHKKVFNSYNVSDYTSTTNRLSVFSAATTLTQTSKLISTSFASTPSTPFTIPSTGSIPPSTSMLPTELTQKTSEAITTTMICPITEGMNNPQYINNPIIIGAPSTTSPSDINPGSDGVDFIEVNPSVFIPFAPGTTPIIVTVSVPNKNTNVNKITVTITEPTGTTIVNEVSRENTNKVDSFPITPLPENSTMTITFGTTRGQPPENVTLSIIACYTPETATTVVTSSTVPPSVSGSTPRLTISSTSTGVTQGTGNQYMIIIERESYKSLHFRSSGNIF
ncbi:unnamed protein product [Rotaria sp. Silwood2]|nr:unnamed protein product [Rotaria sp. Silwood2]